MVLGSLASHTIPRLTKGISTIATCVGFSGMAHVRGKMALTTQIQSSCAGVKPQICDHKIGLWNFIVYVIVSMSFSYQLLAAFTSCKVFSDIEEMLALVKSTYFNLEQLLLFGILFLCCVTYL